MKAFRFRRGKKNTLTQSFSTLVLLTFRAEKFFIMRGLSHALQWGKQHA